MIYGGGEIGESKDDGSSGAGKMRYKVVVEEVGTSLTL